MSRTSLKQQMFNYTSLFRQLFMDYYRHQKKLFWLVQLLMVVSTATGLFWILSIILGISHYQNPANTEGFKYLLFSWVFNMPLWQWLMLASFAGVISAWSLFLSVQLGVKSVLAYQKHLSHQCLNIVSQDKYRHWSIEFEQAPRQVLLRLLRQGVQLTGLVSRRITRAFVSLVTFILAFIVLLYLDTGLLLLLLPLSVFYIIALYFINRYAARISTEMADILPVSSSRFNQLVSSVLNKSLDISSPKFQQKFDDSQYMRQAELKYLRRLSEIHVNWLNTLFLVMGIAIIIIYIVYIQASDNIDWQHLLFFLISLRYAAGSLQQISATTVAFSRFLPEIQLVYRLLNVVDWLMDVDKLSIRHHSIVYIPSSFLDDFEVQQLNNTLTMQHDAKLHKLAEIREQGINLFFDKLAKSSKQTIIIDNNLQRLKRLVKTHNSHVKTSIKNFIIFSNQKKKIQQLTINEFLQYTQPTTGVDIDCDIDAFE
ncbi:MAG: ABC transporter ATP-binding protein [Alcanivoracaceae bacterium]|nr:ABC transporter ATP-binding protein [Alcanivoracaceae bacterium]